MKILTLALVTIFLGGCASTATAIPNFINGKYYMAGDSVCTRYRMLSESRIMCLSEDGTENDYRDAMTDQQLQMYQINKNKSKGINCRPQYGGGMYCI